VSEKACVGCGVEPNSTSGGAHPMVAIVRNLESGKWGAHPVCVACHRDPAHRNNHIKGHFFERRAAQRALAMAGSPNIGG
jgi:hypothetical protein